MYGFAKEMCMFLFNYLNLMHIKSGFARKRYIFGTFLATAALTTIIVAYGDRTNQIQPPILLRGLSVALIQSSGL